VVGTKPLSLTVSEIFNGECNAMVDMTLIGPLNKGQGHSFWYQSISHMRLRLSSIIKRRWNGPPGPTFQTKVITTCLHCVSFNCLHINANRPFYFFLKIGVQKSKVNVIDV